MANQGYNQRLAFDVELTIAASTFTGTAQVLGFWVNAPVKMFIQNQTSVSVFFADNPGTTNGITLVSGESIVVDCKLTNGNVSNTFDARTVFYVTAAAGTGNFKVASLYAY
jgi:hypothetical protein